MAPAAAPRPSELPLVGSLLSFGRDPLGFVERVAREHGDVVGFRVVDHQLLQLSHPDDIETVLVKEAKNLHKDAIYDLLRPFLGQGLVTSEDDHWKRNRKLLAPAFTKRHVESYADAMVRLAREHAATLRDGEERDLRTDLLHLTQRIVLETLFGRDLDVDATPAAEAIETLMTGFESEAQGLHRVLPAWVPTPLRRRSDEAVALLDRTVFAILEARRRHGPGADLLSRLLEARDDAGTGLSDRDLRDEAVTAFVAGHETTALALTWTFVLLGENPDAVPRLLDEARTALGDRPATAADVARLPYTTAVAKEAMRILPPVWAIGRETQVDLRIGRTAVPKGTQLLVSQWVVHRDPRWYAEPLQFRPERWLDPAFEAGLPRMAYFPFGGGPRVCIGNHFALMELVLVLATLSQAGFPRVTTPRPRLQAAVTLRPRDPVRARWQAAPR